MEIMADPMVMVNGKMSPMHQGRAAARVTAEDLYSLPRDERRYELLTGLLISEPPVGGTHGRVVVRLAELLGGFVRSHRLGAVYGGETGFILARSPDTVRAPDI